MGMSKTKSSLSNSELYILMEIEMKFMEIVRDVRGVVDPKVLAYIAGEMFLAFASEMDEKDIKDLVWDMNDMAVTDDNPVIIVHRIKKTIRED